MSAVPIEAEFDAVSYWYPGEPRAVLDEVGWKIERGSFVVLVGPSGSGKSTMLRCLNGLVPHFSGGRMAGAVHVRGLDTRDHGYTETLSETTSCQSIGSSVKIAPGSKRAGCLTFEMPKSAKPEEFQFTLDSGFADETGEWQLR